jgi:hypothetical protein
MKFTYTSVPGELKGNSIVEIDIEYEITDRGELVTTIARTPIIFLSMIADGTLLYININIAAHNHFAQVMQAA